MSFLTLSHRFNVFYGKKRGVLVDTLNEFYVWLESDMCDFLKESINKKFEPNHLTQTEQKCIDYFFAEKVLKLSEKIPDVDTSANTSLHHFNNAIIELDNLKDFENILVQLNDLLIFDIEIRIPKLVTSRDLNVLKEMLLKHEFNSVNVIMKYNTVEDIKNIFSNCQFYLNFWIVTNSKFEDYLTSRLNIKSLPQDINMVKSCGKINKAFFNCSQLFIKDAQQYNSCLKGKISVDREGYIKNCPGMSQHFGNIKDVTLREVFVDKDFKRYWNISKDHIGICKDCEFRYICTDCRAYTDDPTNEYSKPLKCGYNPYTNQWEEWSSNPLKQKSIAYYEMSDLIKKQEAR